MSELIPLDNYRKVPPVDRSGGGGDDGGMEARLSALERDVAVIKSNYMTKEDGARLESKIAEAKNSVITWVVSAIFLAQLIPGLLKALHLLS